MRYRGELVSVGIRREIPHPTTTRCPSRVVRGPPASAPLRARLGNRPVLRGKRPSRPCPPLRLCIAPRLGPASSAYVLLPAQASRLRRLAFAAVAHSGYAVCPSRRFAYTAYALGMACWEVDVRRSGRFLAAARTPLRQMGCCSFVLVRGWWWGVDALATLTEGQRARLSGYVAPGLPHGRHALASGAPGRSRRPRRRRSPHLGHPFIAPARPSSAPRGGARAPAPLPGLRQRAPTRHRPRQIRQRTLCASPLPRPRRTTWHGTPSPA